MSFSAVLDRRLVRRQAILPSLERRRAMQDGGMGGLVKSTVLGAALLTGMALAAQAQ
jgi:hypothetical protein